MIVRLKQHQLEQMETGMVYLTLGNSKRCGAGFGRDRCELLKF